MSASPTLPIVFAGEIRALMTDLHRVAGGNAFAVLFDGFGISAESGGPSPDRVRDDLRLLLQLDAILGLALTLPIVNVIGLPSDEVSSLGRYSDSTAIVNLIRSFAAGGFVHLREMHSWLFRDEKSEIRFTETSKDLEKILAFARACGVPLDYRSPSAGFFTASWSRSGAHLSYEADLTRRDSLTGDDYMCGGHLWCVEPSAHIVEAVQAVGNPIGLALEGDEAPSDVLEVVQSIDTEGQGRCILVIPLPPDELWFSSLLALPFPPGTVWMLDLVRPAEEAETSIRRCFSLLAETGRALGGVRFHLRDRDRDERVVLSRDASLDYARRKRRSDAGLTHGDILEVASVMARVIAPTQRTGANGPD